MESTSFTSDEYNTFIIDDNAGQLQLSNCSVIDNAAKSIIRSDHANVSMTSMEFSGNDVQGSEGQIVLDSESSLEDNAKKNCVAATDDPIPLHWV